MNKIFFLFCFYFLSSNTSILFAHNDYCSDFTSQNNHTKNETNRNDTDLNNMYSQAEYDLNIFTHHLKSGHWRHAEEMLEKEKINVAQLIKNLDYREKEKFSPHWAGLNTGMEISTPLRKLVEISKYMNFQPGEVLVDIGSGHGDPGLVFAALNPGLRVIGFDIVQVKVMSANKMAQRLNLDKQIKFITQDLSANDFKLPLASYFYFFNPASRDVIFKVATQIQQMSSYKDIKVIIYKRQWTPRIFKSLNFQVVSEPTDDVQVWQYEG